MKKLYCNLALLLLPVIVFCQYNDIASPTEQAAAASKTIGIYPNPSTGVVKIDFKKQNNPDISIMVFNSLGREVYAKLHLNNNPAEIDLSNLENGIYTAVFTGTNKTTRVIEKIAIFK